MRSIGRILITTRQLWPLYLGIVAGAVTISATTLLIPFIIAQATDTVVLVTQGTGGSIGGLVWLAVLLLITSLANSALTNVTGYWGDVMGARLRVILSQRYYDKLLRLPQRYYDNELTGTIISRLSRSITAITDFLRTFANSFFPLLLTIGAVLVISGIYSPWLAVLLIVIYPAFVWLTTLTSKRWQVWEKTKNEAYDVAGGRFAEVIGQMRVVKSFLSERHELDRFSNLYDSTVATTREQSRFWHSMDTIRRAVLDVVFFAIFTIIFLQTAQGVYSIGVMVLLIQLVTMARDPVTSMSWLVDTSQRAITGSSEYFSVMDEPDEPNNALEVVPTTDLVHRGGRVIEFDHVSFSYGDTSGPVLEDITLAIGRGERIAFVGESGGGKTTLVNLILKLYPATSGQVRVNGQPVNEIPVAALRREIGVVFQDASLFSGTIRDNIAYGKEGATEEEILAAAKAAFVDRFVHSLPDGYDTVIDEEGNNVSAGEKQLITIARAFLSEPELLILDEATSSVDTRTELLLQKAMAALRSGRTSFVIAHRLSTIRDADLILVMNDGAIVEQGTHHDLLAAKGRYHELYQSQFNAPVEEVPAR